MANWLQVLLSVLGGMVASSGFWAWMTNRLNKKDAKTKMLLGLGHDRIIYLCMKYIERGWITQDEYEDLNKYLFAPYVELGGNGTAERLMTEVRRLPIHHISYSQQAQQAQGHFEDPE